MPIVLPEIPEAESTPLVRMLLDIIRLQQERIQHLEDEITRLKGLKTRPQIAPSALETPPRPPPPPDAKRPGSAKRPKTARLIITEEVILELPDPAVRGLAVHGVRDAKVVAIGTGAGPAGPAGPP
jgi:hypothetical protein